MNIEFTGCYTTNDLIGVSFQALVDRRSVQCVVSREALQDNFPTSSLEESFLLGQQCIQDVAAKKIRASHLGDVLVCTEDLS